jgi:hypothetical protein
MPLNIVCFCYEVNNHVLVLFLMAGKKRASPKEGGILSGEAPTLSACVTGAHHR